VPNRCQYRRLKTSRVVMAMTSGPNCDSVDRNNRSECNVLTATTSGPPSDTLLIAKCRKILRLNGHNLWPTI
jgi:hypothetical protein